MKIAFFEIQGWEKHILKRALKKHSLTFFKEPLTDENIEKAKNAEVISVFIYSKINKKVIEVLKKTKLIATRSTGFDHIDIKECIKRKMNVANVPSYGENTVAEHTFALILALSRNVHKSYFRTLRRDYSTEGLMGFDLKDKTIGVVGAGRIGKHVIRIARGFEMNVLACDRHEDKFLAEQLNFKYVQLKELLKKSDIVTLHVPYSKENHNMINKDAVKLMKNGAVFINTARGALVDTAALIYGLDNGILAGVGLDVIEGEEFIKEEKELLYNHKNIKVLENLIEDEILLSKENVVFTPHIAFYSKEALERIIEKTAENILGFAEGKQDKTCVVC